MLLPEMNISKEDVSISLENPTFDIFYRKYGVRRVTQLTSPVIHDITEASLPKNALYHHNPESPMMFGPLENNPWFTNDQHMKFVKHVVEFQGETLGPVVKKPAPIQLYIQSYRREHRSLKLLRDFFQIDKQANMVVIKNYCFLNHLYRYRPHMLLNYFKFYNFYSTVINTMNSDAKVSTRQQFFEVRLPKQIYRRNTFNIMAKLYEKGMSRRILKFFGDDDSLLMLHLWMWLGPQRNLSIFNKIAQNNLSKINLILTDNGKFCVLNLGELDKWRSNSGDAEDGYEEDTIDGLDVPDEEMDEEGAKGEKPERIQIRFYNLLTQLSSFRNSGAVVQTIDIPKYDLTEHEEDKDLDKEDEEELIETPIQLPHQHDPNKQKLDESLPDELSEGEQDVDKKPPSPQIAATKKVVLPDLPPDPFEDEAEDLSDTSEVDEYLPVDNTDLQPEDHEDPKMVVSDPTEDEILDEEADDSDIPELSDFGSDVEITHENAPVIRAHKLLKDGVISAREFERIQRLASSYKTIPSPYKTENKDETVETFMNIPKEDIRLDHKRKIPKNDFILDNSMLEATTESFEEQYVRKVMNKNIIQSVMSLQKGGFLVTDIQLEKQDDIANNIDVLKIKTQKIGGNESTIVIKLPRVNPETGTMLVQGVEYRMNYQRADIPIRKVSPTEVALTSYYGKLFINKSERRKFNLDKYLITQIQSKIIDGVITNVEYRNVFDKRKLLPTTYQIIAGRFQHFILNDKEKQYLCCFDYGKRSELLGLEPSAVESLELKHGGILFAKSLHAKGEYWFMKPNTDKIVSTTNPVEMSSHRFFGIVNPPPLEMAELDIFSKSIPVGIILGYYLGLTKLLNLLKVTPRKLHRGQRLNLTENEFVIQFADESWVFENKNKTVELILSGFIYYQRYLHDYSARFFDDQEVYGALLRDMGLGSYQDTELRRIKDLFIDDITRSLLDEMNEPTEFIPFLVRAVQLLTTMQSDDEINMNDMIIKGYQRVAGHVYRELMKAMKADDNKRQGSRTKLELSPEQVLRAIMQDSSVTIVDSVNPLHQLKEHGLVTFAGDGGRSKRSMVAHTRSYHESDLGTISEATVDNQNVGVTTYLSANPNIVDVYGRTRRYNKATDGTASILSDSGQLGVASTKDDQL